METNRQASRIAGFGVPVRVPTSLRKLPSPRLPSKARVEEVDLLRKRLLEQAGMAPGVYTRLDDQVFRQAEAVYSGFIEVIAHELSRLDAVDTSVRLYQRNEELLGWFQRHKYNSAADIMLDNPESFLLQQEYLWYAFSPFSQAIRWLIEMAVKYCTPSGMRSGGAKLDYLIQLAYVVQEWDGIWEHIHHNVLPHELIIGNDYSYTIRLTAWSHKASERYKQAVRPYTAKIEKQQLVIGNSKSSLTNMEIIEKIIANPFCDLLNGPFEVERGYNMEDWSRFFAGLSGAFGETEYIKPIGHAKLLSHLSRNWGLEPDRLHHLLNDYALSSELLSPISWSDLRPMEHPRRDTRLLRRPIVALEHNKSYFYLYGIETLEAWFVLFLQRLESGQIGPPIVQKSGAIQRAIGGWQTNLGNELRDEIAAKCTEAGFLCFTEKSRVGTTEIPQKSGFGPVDVFVVDRRNHRFVLAEVKAGAAKGINPTLLRNERGEFLDAVNKLHRQVGWFRERLDDMKHEYGISLNQNFSVEGVVVVNWPRLWMYTHHEPLAVVGDIEFFKMLRSGEELVTLPTPVEIQEESTP